MTTRLSVSARTDTGRVRDRNEDAFLAADLASGAVDVASGGRHVEVGPHGVLLAVSDGVGGHKAGEVASSMTLESVLRGLFARTSPPDADAQLVEATEKASTEVYEAGRRPSLADMEATLTAVLVDGDKAHIAEVGDSRAYVVRSGAIHRLTQDQSLAQIVAGAGAMSADELAKSPLRNVLAQAMGQKTNLSVEVSVLALRQRDCLVLCSDGLTNKVGDDEIAAAILSSPSLDDATRKLVDLANARGGEDNVTVLLAGVSGDVPE